MLRKLNMVIGAFFSEVGTDLLKIFSCATDKAADTGRVLCLTPDWSVKDFLNARDYVSRQRITLHLSAKDFGELKTFLSSKRNFILQLLGNPSLLEHETFTDMLWAVSHLTEELMHRKDLSRLTTKDMEHLRHDVERAYKRLMMEWVDYMKHLQRDYPYLFSLAMRTNPFDDKASVEIK